MPKIAMVKQIKAIERASNAAGLTYSQMMENAGVAVADAIISRIPEISDKNVLAMIGSGNNGGDGLVAARILADNGARVSLYLTEERGNKDTNYRQLKDRDITIVIAKNDKRWKKLRGMIANADILIDSVLGTGLRLPLKGGAKDILGIASQEVARKKPCIVAIDCPSGLDCDTGEIGAETLHADLTVTMAVVKLGLITFPGAEAVGELIIGDIGIREDIKELEDIKLELATTAMVGRWLPERPRNAHKGTFGRLVVIAGSINYPGAAALAGKAAYRVGTGLVTLAVPANIQALITAQIPEVTWILLPHELGVIAEDAIEIVVLELKKATAALIGPGLGRDETTEMFVFRLIGSEKTNGRGHIGFIQKEGGDEGESANLQSCVIDADGLRILAKMDDWWMRLPENSVLTPHPGEMAALTGLDKEQIQEDRIGTAQRWSKKWGHIVVLKGAYTVVASPDGRTTVIPFAISALAKAGTGDVLAGTIAGLRAQGVKAYQAAVLGAFLHGSAAELAVEALGGEEGILASEVADYLANAIAKVRAGTIGKRRG